MEAIKSLVGGVPQDEAARHERCEQMRETALDKCARPSLSLSLSLAAGWSRGGADAALSAGPRVKFLVDAMEKLGCKMQPGFYTSVDCEGPINGGFQIDDHGKPGVRGLRSQPAVAGR